MRALELLRRARRWSAQSLSVFVGDVGQGILEVSHNTLALVGAVAITVGLFGASHPDLRRQAESVALEWLQTRQEHRDLASGAAAAEDPSEPDAVSRATALDLKSLNSEQAAVAQWIARRYRVAVEPVSALVQEAWAVGRRAGLDPTLILAIMAVESSFNPFAQSAVGAQGLMQVMTRVHDTKYEPYGGTHAAFDPITNLRVGVQVLKECIARAGGVAEGLRYYVGAALLESDGGYVNRVMAEQAHLRAVADGRRVPVTVQYVPPAASAPAPVNADEPPAPAGANRDDTVALLRR